MVNQSESAIDAAKRFARDQIRAGYDIESLHEYTDKDDNILFYKIRAKHPSGDKWIRPMYKNEDNKYVMGEPPHLANQLKPLYNLNRLHNFTGSVVVVVEGEYCVDILNAFIDKHNMSNTYIAVTSGSATSAENADWNLIKNKFCIIWPDNDASGLQYAKTLKGKLSDLAECIDPSLLDLDEGGDCIDWLKKNPDATLHSILGLKCFDNFHDDNFNFNQSPTENLSYAEGGDNPQTAELWPNPVDPENLLNEIVTIIQKYIICDDETSHAAALWVVMTWFIDVIDVAPLAVITAPEKRCGKSQLLFLLSKMVKSPLVASNITPAALFRTLDALKPTLLIDETDAFMKDNEELRGILNSGHTRDSAFVIRLVGPDHTPQTFSVFGAKALAGIGTLQDTLMDRAIKLQLRRKLLTEKVERLRHTGKDNFKTLCAKLSRFSSDYSVEVGKARPVLPEELNDRAQDNWEPLFAIAGIAGPEWLLRAKNASLKLSNDEEQIKSINIELLHDIQEVFELKRIDRVTSSDLIIYLTADSEKPWATYNRGLPIKPRQIVTRLSEYGIKSKTIRVSAGTAKGYLKSDFEDTFRRYLFID